jgi:eukaryotic-like serine/threonine-protein kinase
MALSPGTRLGPYEILSAIGSGGMGEVYRARDTQLKRQVAIKVLADSFSQDPDRLARFQREAEVLATLNHPNIAAIYGLEKADGITGIVLELVEGQTLADRIARGPVPLDEALPIAKQIAEALEAAHEQGVVHRDLKPANIKVREDGAVKVLDFGLAKLLDSDAVASTQTRGFSPGLTNSPTITTPAMTMAGVILGTAAYMSPEQVKGRPADKRSDIWAFGCVLYEMLAGRRAFEGEDVSDTLAAVLRGEPDWTALPNNAPASVRALVRRCLQKDRMKRTGDIAAALFVLEEPSVDGPGMIATPPAGRAAWLRVIPLVAAAAATFALTSLMWREWRPSFTPPTVARFTFALPEGQQFTFAGTQAPVLAISPDGTQIVYAVNQGLFLRSISGLEPRAVPGSEGAQLYPTFSPDGRSIAFVGTVRRPSEGAGRSNALKRIAVIGGAPVTLCAITFPSGISWGNDGILFGEPGKGVMRVSASGGTPELLVRLNDRELAHDPRMLPDGETVLFTLAKSAAQGVEDKGQVVVESLKSHRRTTLVSGASSARYL